MVSVKTISSLFLLSQVCAAKTHFIHARAAQDDVTLYAYGTNISGLALVYGKTDGLAYITDTVNTNFSSLTFDITNSGNIPWNGTVNNSTSVGSFYIIEDGFTQAGFVSKNATLASASTIGFSMFGGQVVFIDSSENYLSQFWARVTAAPGVWALIWNSDGSSQDDSVPVTIKKISISS